MVKPPPFEIQVPRNGTAPEVREFVYDAHVQPFFANELDKRGYITGQGVVPGPHPTANPVGSCPFSDLSIVDASIPQIQKGIVAATFGVAGSWPWFKIYAP